MDQRVWLDTVKLSYVSDWTLSGGTYSAALAVPIVIHADVSGKAASRGFGAFRSGDISGLGDLFLLPFQLNWTWGDHHLNLAPAIAAPTGRYDADRLLNLGRNYWAFDPAFSYTWLHSTRGHEVSFTVGYLINTQNPDTGYTTGHEFHLDWLIGQHFSERFAAGINGYWYQQVTDDTGTLPLGFKAENLTARGVGIGPALTYAASIFGKDINLIWNWLHDLETKNRLDGDLVMLSLAFKF